MEKIYCPNCKKITNHNPVHKKENRSDSSADFHWKETFEIIECAGCENVQFKHTYGDEEMANYSSDGESVNYYEEIKLYPPYIEGYDRLRFVFNLPLKIRRIYMETVEAFKAKCYILSGAGFRAIIEAICNDKKIGGNDLQVKINNLYEKKLITEKESKRLHSIRFLGNDSIHGTLLPEPEALKIVLDIVDHLLSNIYLLDLEAENHLETVISSYQAFEQLIWDRSYVFEDKDEITIKEILGKDFRRISEKNMLLFVQNFVTRINEEKIGWLEGNIKGPVDNKFIKSQKLKVKK